MNELITPLQAYGVLADVIERAIAAYKEDPERKASSNSYFLCRASNSVFWGSLVYMEKHGILFEVSGETVICGRTRIEHSPSEEHWAVCQLPVV